MLPPNKPHAPSLGLVSMTQWKNDGFRLNTKTKCSKFEIFNWVAQKKTLKLTTRDMPSKRMDDGDILCHPMLAPSYLQEFDAVDEKMEQNVTPTVDRSHLLSA